jgi:hypothetical protein
MDESEGPRWVLAPMEPGAIGIDDKPDPRSERGGRVSTVVWIVKTLSVIGSVELLVRAATNERSAVRVSGRHVHRPNR